MPDATRDQAGPAAVQGSVSDSRRLTPSGLFGGRRIAFVVFALSLAITLPWSIRFHALPEIAGAAGGAGAIFLVACAILISLLLFALVWRLTSARLHAEAVVLEMTRALQDSEARFKSLAHLSADWYWEQDENYRFTDRSGGGRGWSKRRSPIPLARLAGSLPVVDMSEQDWAAHRADTRCAQAVSETSSSRVWTQACCITSR